MRGSCPCCGQPLPAQVDLLQSKLDGLNRECERSGYSVSFDGYVSEADAAALIGVSRFTLRNWRLQDTPIPFRKLARTPEYALRDLAMFLIEPNRTFAPAVSPR